WSAVTSRQPALRAAALTTAGLDCRNTMTSPSSSPVAASPSVASTPKPNGIATCVAMEEKKDVCHATPGAARRARIAARAASDGATSVVNAVGGTTDAADALGGSHDSTSAGGPV